MKRQTKRAWVAGLALASAFATTASTRAGIVVLENGEVFVGKIREGDVTATAITVHGVRGERGQIKLPRHRVRWFDAEANELTDEYFGSHLESALSGDQWIQARERWIARRSPEPLPPISGSEIFVSEPEIDALPTSGDGFDVHKPSGWSVSVENEILVFQAPPRPSGFTPRIHVFSVASVDSDRSDQVEWIRAELARVSGTAAFQIVELNRLREVEAGENQRLVTETSLSSRKVLAVRQVCFRAERTVFFAGYADAREFAFVRGLLEKSLESLSVR